MSGADSPLGAVFGDRPAKRSGAWRPMVPWIAALVVHGILLAVATSAEPSLEVWSARMAATIHHDLTSQAPIAIEEPPSIEFDRTEVEAEAPQPEVPPTPPTPSRVTPERQVPSQGPPSSEPPPEPAGAGNILSADEDSPAPIDLTGEAFVTGTASAYTGGATASGRASTTPAASSTANSSAVAAAPSLARPVRIEAGAWRCAWPSSAISEEIYEQYVVLRVIVGPDGRAQEARALEDPGNGFAQAAVSCARRTRFLPARNDQGEPIRAASPAIRVRFTR